MLDKISVVLAIVVRVHQVEMEQYIRDYYTDEHRLTDGEMDTIERGIYESIGFETDCEISRVCDRILVRGKTEKAINDCIDALYCYYDGLDLISAESIINPTIWE